MAIDASKHNRNLAQILGNDIIDPTDAQSKVKGLLYSTNGVGKTIWFYTVANLITPPDQTILVVDTSGGWVSMRNHPQLMAQKDRFKVFKYRDIDHLDTLLMAMATRKLPGLENVGCVILDEFSKMVRRDVNEISESSGREVPEWPDYNRVQNRIAKIVNEMVKFDVHLFMTAHETFSPANDARGTASGFKPNFPPSVAGTIMEDLHFVGRMTAQNVPQPGGGKGVPTYKRVIQVQPTGGVDAKSRLPHMPIKVDAEVFAKAVIDWSRLGSVDEEALNEIAHEVKEGSEGIVVGDSVDTVDVDSDDQPIWSA